ncbi:MAG: hypothetical protein AAGB48_00405 [Planctomycetota bacterium]
MDCTFNSHAERSGWVQPSGRHTALAGAVRLVWTLLALVHLVPLVLVGLRLCLEPSWLDAGSFLLLLAVTGLFGAKAANVSWLRTDRPVFEAVAWLIAGALAHGDVAVPIVASQPSLPVAAVIAGGSAAMSRRARLGLNRGLRGFESLLDTARAIFASLHARVVIRLTKLGSSGLRTVGRYGKAAEPLALGWSARPPPLLA